MKKLKQCLYTALLIGCVAGCKKEDRTTVVFGKVTDDTNHPIEGVEMTLYGKKGLFAALTTPLKTVYTDAKGEYTITAEIPKDYHGGNVGCLWFRDPLLDDKYSGGGGVFQWSTNPKLLSYYSRYKKSV
jgi:hypothetical protein